MRDLGKEAKKAISLAGEIDTFLHRRGVTDRLASNAALFLVALIIGVEAQIVRKYNAGRRVTVMFEKTGETYLLKKGEETWRFNLPDQTEVEKSKHDPHEDLRPENRTAQDERDGERQQEDEMDFMSKVEEVAARDGITKTAAMEKVRKRNPDLYQQFQNSTPVVKAAPERVTKSAAQVKFEDKCADVAKARGLPMTRAMDFVRKQYPDLYTQAYG